MPKTKLRPLALLFTSSLLLGCSARRSGASAVDDDLRCSSIPEIEQSGGKRDRNAIMRKIREHYPALESCFQAAVERNAGAKGKLETRLVIESSGSVSSACVQETTMDDGQAVECMVDELRSIKFGRADGAVTIVHPIGFAASP